MLGPPAEGPGVEHGVGGWGDINIHIAINMNIDIHIIINMNIEYYIIYYLFPIVYSLLAIIYSLLAITYVFQCTKSGFPALFIILPIP